MKVQIYTMQSVEEALEVMSLGVDHLGITPSSIGLPGEIDFCSARYFTFVRAGKFCSSRRSSQTAENDTGHAHNASSLSSWCRCP